MTDPAWLAGITKPGARTRSSRPTGSSVRSIRQEAVAANATAATASAAFKRAYVRRVVLTDLLIVAAAVTIGYLARFQGGEPGTSVPYGWVGLGLTMLWLLVLLWSRAYDDRILGYGLEEYQKVIGATLKLAGGVAIACYLADVEIARGFLALSFAFGVVMLPVGRWISRESLRRARSREKGWSRRVLVVGDASHVLELHQQLRREITAGYHVVGACIPDSLIAPQPQHLDGVPVVGSFRNILAAAAAVSADTIAVTGSGELTGRRLRRLGWQMEGTGIDLVLAPTLTDVAGPRIHTRPVAGLPLIHVSSPEFSGTRKWLKGIVDRALAAFIVLLVSPIFLALILAIKVDSPGPAFFRQRRVGQDGQEFDMLKFRSMVINADALVAQLSAHNEGGGLMFKMKDDPRVTRVGRILRRFSLDELPQLINVLRGDMSLVGPRPPLPTEVAWYDQDVARRLLVKPGMTGLWQVSGRSDLSWEDSIRLDLYYVENWSLTADLQILWRTVGAVVRSRGAY